MASIVDMVRDVITPDVIRGASNVIGENAVATQGALKVAAPTVLAGALSNSSDPSGAERLFNTITNGRYGSDLLGGLGRMLESRGAADSLLRSGEGLVSTLFGTKTDAVSDAVSRAGGVSMDSATKILRLAAPMVLSVLGKQISSRGLDARGLGSLLSGERGSILSALPSGLARSLGLDEPAATGAHAREHEPETSYTRHTERAHGQREVHVHRKRSLKPALIGGLAALALLFLLSRNRRDEREVTVQVPPAAERIQEAPPVMAPPAAEMPAVSQPSDNFSEIETYLTETGSEAGRNFVLKGVVFESGSAQLSPQSGTTISSLAALLKAHPNTVIRLEGHTDAQGNAAANRKLALNRAVVLKKELVKQGARDSQIQTKGVGPDKPVASNDTEEGRAQNRRTEIVIIKK